VAPATAIAQKIQVNFAELYRLGQTSPVNKEEDRLMDKGTPQNKGKKNLGEDSTTLPSSTEETSSKDDWFGLKINHQEPLTPFCLRSYRTIERILFLVKRAPGETKK
jgi:hypothetical protein